MFLFCRTGINSIAGWCWRHDMEKLPALPALCERSIRVAFPSHRGTVTCALMFSLMSSLITVEQTVELPMIWEATALMWCQCNGNAFACSQCCLPVEQNTTTSISFNDVYRKGFRKYRRRTWDGKGFGITVCGRMRVTLKPCPNTVMTIDEWNIYMN